MTHRVKMKENVSMTYACVQALGHSSFLFFVSDSDYAIWNVC